MILVLLSYKVSPDEIDRLRPAHIAWLKQGMANGMLLAAGRKVPVTGGAFIAKGALDEVRAWAMTDPFATEGAADYEFIEIATTMAAPGLDALLS